MVQLKIDGLVIAVYRLNTAPTSTTNMTGLRIWTRGSSFLNASGVDFQSIPGSSRPAPIRCGASVSPRPLAWGVVVTAISVQSFGERAQGEGGEVGEADQDEDHADHHPDEQGCSGIERPGAGRDRLLSGERSGQAEREDLRREPAEQHHEPAEYLVPGRARSQAGERRAVVVCFRGERVHDLGQAVRPRVEDAL